MTQNELENYIRNFLQDDNFTKLGFLKHHNTTRLIHTLNVTICSYRFAKRFNLNVNYESLIKGCLLHDFFLYQQYKCPKGHIHAWYHPKEAYRNAIKYYEINNIEKDMILKHMYPTDPFKFPKYKETWIIILCDKYCATIECFFKKNYLQELKSKNKKELKNFFEFLKTKNIC